MNDGQLFPTFFHISEYGTAGYDNLHAMVAVSSPLNLWAPSSVFLKNSAGRISPKDFLDFVENHHIRILAREKWLTDPSGRNNHKWPGAAWDKEIDGKLRRMYEADRSLPDDSPDKRVIAAGPEIGWSRADEYLQLHPDQVGPWTRILRSTTAADRLPPGTLEEARRRIAESGFVQEGVRSVIRDVWNHGDAYQLSQARVAFNRPEHDRFIKLLAKLKGADPATRTPPGLRERQRAALDLATATEELVEALGYLAAPGRSDLKKFMKREERDSLVTWFDRYCDEIKRTTPKQVDGEVLRKLAVLVNGEFEAGIKAMRKHPIRMAGGSAGLAISVIGAMVDPTSALGILSLGASAFTLGTGFCQLVGLVPANFTGEQWPYLYAYGKEATQRRKQALSALLNRTDGVQ